MAATKAEKAEALARLREWLKPGDTVYTILEHVSSSGMSRAIRFVLPRVHVRCDTCGRDADGERLAARCSTIATGCAGAIIAEPYHLHPNHAIGTVLGLRFHTSRGVRSDALHVTGCGMDMGFNCVYHLGRYLWPDGVPCSGANCQSNDHSNDRNCKRDGTHLHRDGGVRLASSVAVIRRSEKNPLACSLISLPDSDPIGPFDSEDEAIEAARE